MLEIAQKLNDTLQAVVSKDADLKAKELTLTAKGKNISEREDSLKVKENELTKRESAVIGIENTLDLRRKTDALHQQSVDEMNKLFSLKQDFSLYKAKESEKLIEWEKRLADIGQQQNLRERKMERTVRDRVAKAIGKLNLEKSLIDKVLTE